MDKRVLGQEAEKAAAAYLQQRGYTILETNYRNKMGEIDIIAWDREILVFVEVRSRRGSDYGLPQETVSWIKQQKVRKLASYYLKKKNLWKSVCRFDVIGIMFDQDDKIKSIELIQDAF